MLKIRRGLTGDHERLPTMSTLLSQSLQQASTISMLELEKLTDKVVAAFRYATSWVKSHNGLHDDQKKQIGKDLGALQEQEEDVFRSLFNRVTTECAMIKVGLAVLDQQHQTLRF